MTKREMFVAIANVAEVASNPEMVEFINHQIELLDNRKSAEKKPTKVQTENVAIKDTIIQVLADAGTPLTVTEMIADARLSVYTNQKISALLRQMTDKVVKTMDGKKARFSLA